MCGFMGCGGENGRFGGGVAVTWYIEVGWPPTHEDFKLHSQIRATEILFSASFGGPLAAALREDVPRISITCTVYPYHFYTDSRLLNLLYRNLFASSIYSMSALITISTVMIHSVPSGRFSPAHRSARLGSTQYLSKIAHLALDQKRVTGHLFWLGESHSLQDRWRNISKNTISLLQRPALWSVGHDEWDLVSGVGSLWLSILELHLLSVTVIELAC